MNAARVLNTRPSEQAGELSALLRRAGFEPLEQPTISLQPSWQPASVRKAIRGVSEREVEWIVFPSRAAVRFLDQALRETGRDLTVLRSAKLLCGPGTAEELTRAGLRATRVLSPFSAATACQFLATLPDPPHGVLLPRAQEGRPELPDGLRGRGIACQDVVLYQTRPVDPTGVAPIVTLLRQRALAAITFASPSSARGLLDGLRALGHEPRTLLDSMPLVCMGDTTASALLAAGFRPTVAADTTVASLVSAVREATGASI